MQQVTRCAVYTRKSVEEGLEQEFNTLDAQRMACESYIVTKRLTEKGILRFPERNKPFDTVMVATALRNCVYIGRVPLKNESFKGIHEPIIDMELGTRWRLG